MKQMNILVRLPWSTFLELLPRQGEYVIVVYLSEICMKFSGKVGNGTMNKRLNFVGDPDHRLDTGIVFRIRHYFEIRKVVNGHKSAAHTDSPDGGTGKTCLDGGMHCPIASSK